MYDIRLHTETHTRFEEALLNDYYYVVRGMDGSGVKKLKNRNTLLQDSFSLRVERVLSTLRGVRAT